ncbi:hypothetical protein G7061_06855 [Erysipelothrix sp. HDW6B]|uniref:P-loop NTPase fold protein n=1 Tax=Erysipelothrix sp. HDW6B TaxID=2714929 RepID=UPI00140E0B22|nr:P-loop NTPase fold protein [Erysipelothrix sp. HDW6B]QIK86344.1 hypothetical protein G7061_06855 [Erysipelothrix sp. HDW6B]
MIDFNYYGRENFSEVFIERLTSGKNLTINASSHILLNGKWGSGKTMLVEELMKKINLDQGYQTKALILNAWEMDYLEDPNVAIFKTLYDSGYLNIKQLDDDIHGHIKKIKKDYLGIKKGIIDTTNEFVSSKLGVEPLSYGIHGSDFFYFYYREVKRKRRVENVCRKTFDVLFYRRKSKTCLVY